MARFLAMFQAIVPLIQAAEGIFVGPGKGTDKFNFVLGAVNFGISKALPDFQAAIHIHDVASINQAAGDAINLLVAGLNNAGKLGPAKPTVPALGGPSMQSAGSAPEVK